MNCYPKILTDVTSDGKSCYTCNFFSDGNCIREKILVDYSPEDHFPIFNKELLFCARERSGRQPWRCGPRARYFKPKKNYVNSFKRNSKISHDSEIGRDNFTVIYEPGTFFTKDGEDRYVLRNEENRMYCCYPKLFVESNFTQTDFSIDSG